MANKLIKVSVPLRGKYRGEYLVELHIKNHVIGFPSPCGVNIVANFALQLKFAQQKNISGFRPLAG